MHIASCYNIIDMETNVMEMKLNKEKYNNAILYFFKYCNNEYLGITKLNKLMYYLDFISYRDNGCSVSNDRYMHKNFGPVPDKIDDMLANLKADNKIGAEKISYKGHHKTKFSLKSDPDMAVFTEYEKGLLSNICNEFAQWATNKIVSQTHLEAPWFYSKPYDFVDYKYASNIEFFQSA